MKRVQVFLESDIVIRHFVHSNILQSLEDNYEVQYVFPKHSRVKSDIEALGLKNYRVIEADSKRLTRLRNLIKVSGIRKAKRNPKYNFLLGMWEGLLTPGTYKYLEKRSRNYIYPFFKIKNELLMNDYKELQEIIDEFKPDLVIHPSVLEGLFITDLIKETKKRKIELLVLMNSWDNPSTKSTLKGVPDHLVVWGEQTKTHAVEFMGMPEENIYKWGSAQFDVYKKEPTVSREEFCKLHGIDPEKKIILYAGSSKSINEIEHLRTLESAIESGELENAHIVFRPHPWRAVVDGEEDYFSIDWKHVSMDVNMIDTFKRSNSEEGKNKINLTSYMDTHNILSSCDILVSNISTILLEAALHGMPIMCMVSDEEVKTKAFLRVTLQSLYFKEILTKLDVPRCKNHEEIVSNLKNLLEQSNKPGFKEFQLERTSYFVESGSESYKEKLNNFVASRIN